MKMSMLVEVAVFDGIRTDVGEIAILVSTSLSSEKARRCLLPLLGVVNCPYGKFR
jgi:hypothetical protein